MCDDLQAVDTDAPAYQKKLRLIQQEVSMLENLNHENVVRCWGIDKSDESDFFSFSFCSSSFLISKLLVISLTFSVSENSTSSWNS